MNEIEMLLLSRGKAKPLRRRRPANTFHWAHAPKAKLANSSIRTAKTQRIIVVLPLHKKRLRLRLNTKKKLFHQKKAKMPQLRLRQRGKTKEKAKVEDATERKKERRGKERIDKLRSVQSFWLFRPHCRCMVSIGQKRCLHT